MVNKKLEDIKQGDIILVSLDPTVGHEQRGYRPCIVLSNKIPYLNNMYGVAPITSKNKSFPLHIDLPNNLNTTGQVLIEQHRMIDLSARQFRYAETADEETVQACLDRLALLYK